MRGRLVLGHVAEIIEENRSFAGNELDLGGFQFGLSSCRRAGRGDGLRGSL
jgi:hypothetical protein